MTEYILLSGDTIVGQGTRDTLMNCFGSIGGEDHDASMAALAFDMDCQLFKRIDPEFINPLCDTQTQLKGAERPPAQNL